MHGGGMPWFRESQDHLPLTWWKGHPIYLAAVLALAAFATMVLTAVLMAMSPSTVAGLTFSYENVAHRLFLWTPVTYGLVNYPSLWLVLGCFFLWRFGEAVERHLGRAAFVRLVLLLLGAMPLVVFLLGLAGYRPDQGIAGVNHLQFGVFLAFATLYPRAQLSLLIATIEVWVLAAVIVGVYALIALASRDWVSLLMLGTELAVAYGFIRHEQGRLTWPRFQWLKKRAAPVRQKRERNPGADLPAKPARSRRREAAAQPAVDDILEKISREGMHSLTPEERVILERASHDLQRRKRR
jgi:membrane associated rhomboid family serine protease